VFIVDDLLPILPGLAVKVTQAGEPTIPRVTPSILTTDGPLLQAGFLALRTLSWHVQNAISQKVFEMCNFLRFVISIYSILWLWNNTTTTKMKMKNLAGELQYLTLFLFCHLHSKYARGERN
jgi:hypothetical protein